MWRRLWDGYLVFYGADLPEDQPDRLWRRLLDPDDPVEGLVAELDAEVVGLVHFFPHDDTWQKRQVCYLQDLYVDPEVRGGGIGEALIREVARICAQRDWAYLYWQTAEDNTIARGLYDKLTGGRNRFVVYEMEV